MLKKIKETVSYIQSKSSFCPEIGLILGTGLGRTLKEIKTEHIFEYKDIPHFPVATAEGHAGKLIFGWFANKKIVALDGRLHYYEGYTMEEITFPVRVMKYLDIKYLFVTNASGGLNPDFQKGDLMILTDHINLLPNPLIGNQSKEFGPMFPDMSQPYDTDLIDKAISIAQKNNIKIRTGCYVGTTGPSIETPKEYNYFRIIGGDAVGMSTIPEIIVARQMNLPCFALAVITNLGVQGKIRKLKTNEVQLTAEKVCPEIALIIKELIASL